MPRAAAQASLSPRSQPRATVSYVGTLPLRSASPRPPGSSRPASAGPRKPRRDDLKFVGNPLPPAKGEFTTMRSTCSHPTGSLAARGGRNSTFWWTCMACGSRWERTDEKKATPQGLHKPSRTGKSPIRPQVKTESKEEASASTGPARQTQNFHVATPRSLSEDTAMSNDL